MSTCAPQMADAPLAPNLGEFLPCSPHHGWVSCQFPQFLAQRSVCLLELTVQGWRKCLHQPEDHMALQHVPVERKETDGRPQAPGKPPENPPFVCVCVLVTQSCPTLCDPHGLLPTRLLCPWDSPGKDTGVGCHFLLQGIFPTWGLNLGLLHCRQILYHLSYEGNFLYRE